MKSGGLLKEPFLEFTGPREIRDLSLGLEFLFTRKELVFHYTFLE